MQKFFDSELKVMELLWEQGPMSAKALSLALAERIGWNKNTTYTIIKKLEAKGALRRDEPGFLCTPLVSREQAQQTETRSLVERLFGGSRAALFSALIGTDRLSETEAAALHRLIDASAEEKHD